MRQLYLTNRFIGDLVLRILFWVVDKLASHQSAIRRASSIIIAVYSIAIMVVFLDIFVGLSRSAFTGSSAGVYFGNGQVSFGWGMAVMIVVGISFLAWSIDFAVSSLIAEYKKL